MSDENALVPLPQCSHPELVEYKSHWPDNGMTYQCSACKKKIVIPSSTFIWQPRAKDAEDAIAGIIGLAFGEKWKEILKR